MEINELYNLYKQYGLVTTDTRNCPEGALFFALKGENFNGNKFALTALENGCSYAIVDEWEGKKNPRIIMVSNVLLTLQKLANYHRRKLKIPIVGITGSNGKTTTKELVATILAKEFKVASTQGNYNNHIGVPLTLLSMNNSHEIGVVEMGANKPGDIKELSEICEPNFGLITSLGKAHVEGFGSFEGIIKTKGELYDFIREHNGKVFVSKDNLILFEKSEGMDRILYGRNDESLFVSGNIVVANPFLEFTWSFFDNSHYVKTRLVGNYNLDNVLAAAVIGKFFGIHAEYISEALEEYEPKNSRSQFERTECNDLIIDAYNANPTSMKASLDSFSNIDSDLPKVVILGEMKELGEIAEEEHREILRFVLEQPFEKAYLVGDIFKNLSVANEKLFYFLTVEELCEELEKNPISKHYILLKGSNSIRLDKCVKWL
jgi:UDP-N-acetylmuramoyl-tripeptide--D-alanyl-D-alanine ligase